VDSLRSYVSDASVDEAKAQMDFEEKILIKFPLSSNESSEKKSLFDGPSEKKNILDFSFRKFIEQLLIKSFEEDKSIMDYNLGKLLDLAILLVRKDCLEPLSIVLFLEDLFDCQTVEACRQLFEYVESRTEAICTLPFGRSQLFLVRACISLLKKLSKSTNEDSLFCGKILMFLAYAVPLADKSGVNAKGEINTSNVTEWDASPVLNDSDMYRSFWSLQPLFQNISQIIQDDNKWTEFVKGVHSVCNFFEKHSLKKGVSHSIPTQDKDSFFPKYLTSSQLWSLEVEDIQFRRNILVQMMISLHTIQNPLLQPKTPTEGLKDDQKTSLSDLIQRISKLLEKTASNVDEKQFLQTLQTLLQREKTWITWKRAGCQPFEKYAPKQAASVQPLKRKQQTEASGEKKFRFANAELSRLWNLNVTEDALTSISRTHTPSLQDFLKPFEEQQKRLQMKKEQPPKPENENENQEAVEKDPFEDDEDEILLQNNEVYSWKALRLVARHKLQFFSKMSKNKLQDALQLLENERKGQQIDDGNSFSENTSTGNDTKMETDEKEIPTQDEQMPDIDKADNAAELDTNDNEIQPNEDQQAAENEIEAESNEPTEIRTPELNTNQPDIEERQENSEEEVNDNQNEQDNEADNNREADNNQDEQEEDIPDDVSIHDEEDDASDPEN